MSIESRKHQYGTVFGHWQIKEFLGSGSGGKSAVFRMEHTESAGVESALKVVSLIEERGCIETLSPQRRNEYKLARKEFSDRAEKEVLLMNVLQGNTNIVDYLDHTFVDWSDETGFGRDMLIRMEKLSDLRGQISAGKHFNRDEILQIGKDICTALILCHKKGILHRDIKPENIYINKNGNYKLGDFGISRIVNTTSSFLASTGVGTPQYWAPEQTSGRYDVRVDVYSLGLVLYELSNCNRLPFAESSYVRDQEIHRRLLGEALPYPCEADEAIAQVILKACAFLPENRYQTAEDFLRALNNLDGTYMKGHYRSVPARGDIAQSSNRTMPAQGNATQASYRTVPAQSDTSQANYRTVPAQSDASQQLYRTMPAKNDASQQVYRTMQAQGSYYSPQQSSASSPVTNKSRNWKTILPWIIAVLAVSLAIFLFMHKDDNSTTPVDNETQAPPMSTQAEKPKETYPPVSTQTEPPIATNPPATQHEHSWKEATYNEPETCTTCGEKEGPKKTPSVALGLRDIVSSAKASSVYSGDDLGVHSPEKMYDGKLNTNWTENAYGNGVGEYVTLNFDDTYAVKELRIYIGSHFSEGLYKQNCRPKVITLTFSDGSTKRISLEDSYDEQIITFDLYYYTDYVKITIEEVYTGTKYPHTVIAELDLVAYRP